MKQNLSPQIAGAIIAVVVVAVCLISWKLLSAPPTTSKSVFVNKSGQPAVTHRPDGSLQFSPEAQAHRGPQMPVSSGSR